MKFASMSMTIVR